MDTVQTIIPGLTLSPAGQATIDPPLHQPLFDLALALEAPTGLPVDIQHVVAALVMARQKGDIDKDLRLTGNDAILVTQLAPYVQSLFDQHGGILGEDE
ncbi:hypothetical protein K227x_38130 [Rubripirellula lacrimiformis]|uniref:Uncharacterized protein n=1 Tax=Rubripirellula lacrimiformis TaxID=1930273 RepID=A0A517NE47_9BACT|nr:hypothetical protein [Rubripirellula lacrimiformis]QDT05413.1 hypothetical protein K227x_38130 [Rubripirellula lacrimiformis]